MKIKEVYDFLDFIAPFNTAAEWDNCGLSVGSLENEVTKILVALDVTEGLIEEAVKTGAELVVTHHPLIFTPVSQIESESLVYKAVKSGVTFISSHTCLDKAIGGVNDCLAVKVGIKNVQTSETDGCLKTGEIEPCSASAFAKTIKNALGGKVAFTDNGKEIKKVAFCSGAGGDFINAAAELGADALLTGEAKHHEYLEANRLGIALFDAGHYETEVVVCEFLRKSLDLQFDGAEVLIYDEKPPVKYI
ncbi:MAG: Nif3-like dinuclear metal center hexameric protein [Clostridia bacterium]|nr:Nif3-like dinuclear metal center hexameric protein [Clostridia bacterium]